MTIKHATNFREHVAEMIGLGLGAKAKSGFEKNFVAAAEILNVDGRHGAVGNRQKSAFVGAHAGGAEADVFDGPGAIAKAAGIADADDFVAEDGDSAKKIRNRLLRAEADRQTSDAEAGEGGGHVEPQRGEHGQRARNNYDCFDNALTEEHERSGTGVPVRQGPSAHAEQKPSETP